jgi:CBS domain-containing membrane protein
MTWLKKLLPYLISESTTLSGAEKLRATLAAFMAILAVGMVSSQFLQGNGLQIMITSMGASAVLLFATPHSPLTQPWPLVAGHAISALIGVTCAIQVPDIWLAAALAVSLSILAMLLTHSLHPPGGAIALLPVLDHHEHVLALGYQFVVAPVMLNVLVILLVALLVNNLLPGRRYPSSPLATTDKQHRHEDQRPLDRLGINKDDLQQALKEMDVFLDISKSDLDRVYRRAGMASYRRRMGELTCDDIMSRDLVTVEFGTELEEVWAQLRFHKIKSIPVLDRARRVIGIISLVDILKRANLKTYETFEDKLIKFIRRTPGVTSDKAEVAGQVMATPVFTVREDAHILELVPLLSNKGLHQVPVVNSEDRLVGMVTQSDLIAALYHSGVH